MVGVEWSLCDNGFPAGHGLARFVVETGQIDWLGAEPPVEDEGLLRQLMQRRVRDYLAGI